MSGRTSWSHESTGRSDMSFTMQCPKCRGAMRTYNRNGIQIEQCDNCRGIFLDYGELEAIARVEAQYSQPVPPPPAPGYGAPAPAPAYGQPGYGQPAWGHGHQRHGKHGHGGFARMLFST